MSGAAPACHRPPPPRPYEDPRLRILDNSTHAEPGYNGTPCWEWNRSVNNKGYPRLSLRRKRGERKGRVKKVAVHRYALQIFHGITIKRGKVCRHWCNNKRCVNPAHLEFSTQAVNMQQCVADGRHRGFENR